MTDSKVQESGSTEALARLERANLMLAELPYWRIFKRHRWYLILEGALIEVTDAEVARCRR